MPLLVSLGTDTHMLWSIDNGTHHNNGSYQEDLVVGRRIHGWDPFHVAAWDAPTTHAFIKLPSCNAQLDRW